MSHFNVLVIGDDPEKQLAPYQENNMGDCPKEFLTEFVEDEEGHEEHEGVKGYWDNPNTKWDWYELGGRWAGSFKLKEDTRWVDQCRKGDVDWDGMRNELEQKAHAKWDTYIEPRLGDDKAVLYFHFGLTPGMTKEDYIKRQCTFSAYAVLMNGKWYERGTMGWWGVSVDEDAEWPEKFSALLDDIPDDVMISVYDCHI